MKTTSSLIFGEWYSEDAQIQTFIIDISTFWHKVICVQTFVPFDKLQFHSVLTF